MTKTTTKKREATQHDARLYLYSVGWSEEDTAYIGRVAEFSSLASHGGTPDAALKEIMTVVRFVLRDLKASGEDIPAPFSRRSYSGKLNVRIPPSLHRRLALGAAREGVSLNQWINSKLEQ